MLLVPKTGLELYRKLLFILNKNTVCKFGVQTSVQ